MRLLHFMVISRFYLVEYYFFFVAMDWNSRTPVQWDWETLGLFNGEEAELSKPSKDRKSKRESGIAIGTDYAYSMGMAVCSSSEVGDCSFRSSNSASADSSKAKKRIPEINRPVEGLLHNHRVVKSRTSDPYIGTSNKNSTSSSHIITSTVFTKNSRVCEKSTLSPYCQVEGCNIDLTTAKDYHQKHRVCQEHAKSPKVTVGGQECRFCQQCSRLCFPFLSVNLMYLVSWLLSVFLFRSFTLLANTIMGLYEFLY